MKIFIAFIIIVSLLFSCKKKEETIEPVKNSISEDLQKVVKDKGVQAIVICRLGLNCYQSFGYGTDYSFEGDNILRVKEKYYNLIKLEYYVIETYTVDSKSEIRMIIYFP